MSTKHTQGPWDIRDDDDAGVVSIVGGSQIVIAYVRTATVEPGDDNARLISTSPEMLEALELAFVYLNGGPGYTPENHKSAYDAVRSVIAKATGAA